MTGAWPAYRVGLAAGLLLVLACGGDQDTPGADGCAGTGTGAAETDTACAPDAAAVLPAPPPPPDASLRPAITAMLDALLDSTVARPLLDSTTPLVAPVAAMTMPAIVAAPPRLVCLAPEPLPDRDAAYDARLRFLADPDSALLAALARPGVLLFHPRRCPPTLETTAGAAGAHRVPGEDPTWLSVRDLAEGEGGALYADVAVARGARGAFWVCAVMRDDPATVRCTPSDRSWTR